MTYVTYECEDVNGKKFSVNTQADAEKVKEAGGHYKQVFTSKPSNDEAHCRIGARHAGELR